MSEIREVGEEPKKNFILRIPLTLRLSIIWTIFFSIIGLVFEYIKGNFNFSSFFVTNYLQWFRDFGILFNNSSLQQILPSSITIYQPVLNGWYYFFITGGLIALLWGIIAWIINLEFAFRRNSFKKPALEVAKPFLKEQKVEANETTLKEKQKEENIEKINEWLTEGLRFLSEGNLEEAELIYNNIKQEYDAEEDAYGVLQRRIVSFYEEIISERREQGNKK
jgi:hypothetical protein